MATWYPNAMSYREWCQAESFLAEIKDNLNNESYKIRKSIILQTNKISEQTKSIVANDNQILSALENGFEHIIEISEQGFRNVTEATYNVVSAVEALHSDLNINLGIIIQQIEYQNSLLSKILDIVQAPFETQVKEFYSKGCLLIHQGIIDKAADYLKKSLELPTGDIFYPSYYQLGLLYLTGKHENINIIDPKKANEYLLIANRYGTGILRTNESFRPILADCKFFISQSYYFQMTGQSNEIEKELLINAIKFAEEAVILNPNLSQGYYHLAKYYSFDCQIDKMLFNLNKAIEIDRDYSYRYEEDMVFDKNKKYILPFLEYLTELKKKIATQNLLKAKNYIQQLELKNISESSSLFDQFQKLRTIVFKADCDFKTKTYFGYDDCQIKLNEL